MALTSGLPLIVVPTTYAGSEMTSIYGITDGGVKRTGRDPRVPATHGSLRSDVNDVTALEPVGQRWNECDRTLR